MEMTVRACGPVTMVHVDAERIDAAAAIQFKDRFRALTDGGSGTVILDLGRVAFLDSSGLGAVVAVRKHLGTTRKLDLAALNPTVDKVMRLTRMDTVFAIHLNAEAALAAHGCAPTG